MKISTSLVFTGLLPGLAACGGEEPISFNNSQSQPECFPNADTCTGEQICVGAKCEAAFNRFYRIGVANGEIAASKPDSFAWDEGSGGTERPDPYVIFMVNGVEMGRTMIAQDTNAPVWNEYIEAQLAPGSTVAFVVRDSDLVFDDDVFTCEANPITSDLLRGRELACQEARMGGTILRGRIEPKVQ